MNRLINIPVVFKLLSRNLFILSGALFICSIIAIFLSERSLPFLLSALIALIIGISLHLFSDGKSNEVTMQRKDAYLTVTISWFTLSLIGSFPYLLSGAIPSFIDAFFESVSGFTTTGSSILTDIDILPKSILFWRSLTHWIGGIGIIVLVIIVMPTLRIGGYHLFTMESSLQEKIQPKIKMVGYRLLFIYIGLTVVEMVLLLFGGMNFFESVCHAFGTIATGGFSPRNTSIGGYSAYIQYVVMVFMLLSGTNFVIHYYILKRNFGRIKENEELKFYLSAIAGVGLFLTGVLIFNLQKPVEESFREAFFQTISIITCTGYATADYLLWPQFAWILLFMAMFLGGSTGSTAGGIKMARHLILFKNYFKIFRQLAAPNAIIPLRLNNKALSDESNNSILTFISVYLLVFFIGTLIMIFIGVDAKTASSSVATCMAGIGPGVGTVGPASNFAHLPEVGKILLSFLMLIGRLEIYTVIILFTKSFWKQ